MSEPQRPVFEGEIPTTEESQADDLNRRDFMKVADDHIAGRSENSRLLWQLLMLDKSVSRIFG